MVGGGAIPGANNYEGRFTIVVALACIVASSGGFIFGYDIGISGGVTSMDSFLQKFFPRILRTRNDKNTYCRFNDQILQAFTSSLYLTGLILTFAASYTTKWGGRRQSMLIGGLSFVVGAILNGSAQNIAMLIIGRICLGVGVGFGNQAVPLYLSEMAPSKWRGALNNLFQFTTTLGILIANCINYGTGKVEWGWRLSLGLALIPGLLLTMGGLCLPETPNSLIERNRLVEGKLVLLRIRGIDNVDDEYGDILRASQMANDIKNPLRDLFSRQYIPQLSVVVLVPMFQQLTGINAIMFYAPVLFKTIGFKDDAALYSAIITGCVILLGCVVSILTVDRWGRRVLFLTGGLLMFICQMSIGLILKFKLPIDLHASLPHSWGIILLVLISFYVFAFGWSWGPLGWLVPTEILPLEIRSAGQSLVVSVNFLFTFIVGQAFLTMLCSFKWAIFLFFAFWVLVMSFYVKFFLPETKNIPLEEMKLVWGQHPFWKRFVSDEVNRPYAKEML